MRSEVLLQLHSLAPCRTSDHTASIPAILTWNVQVSVRLWFFRHLKWICAGNLNLSTANWVCNQKHNSWNLHVMGILKEIMSTADEICMSPFSFCHYPPINLDLASLPFCLFMVWSFKLTHTQTKQHTPFCLWWRFCDSFLLPIVHVWQLQRN